ncbi:MAG: GNAT family N-acetyltransferase [Candidatus Binatia bacterium]|nr:GNAT family N-acetyltransferase [Candidatus Binatia bacterium]
MTPATATENVLDNVAWHALRGPQARLSQWEEHGRAGRFDPEVTVFTAVDRLDDEAWAAQARLVGPGGTTILFRDEVPTPPAGWQEVFRGPTWQLVAGDLGPPAEVPVEALAPDDAAEMLALTQLTEPGPFLLRTIELGTYVGIRHEGKIVAMAGERLKAPGFTEVSAVCTHSNARRLGYGAALTLWMAAHIRKRGDEAFLHVLASNESALRLYEAIGFRRRRNVDAVAAVWTG